MPGQTHQESKNETEMGYFPLCIKTSLTVGWPLPPALPQQSLLGGASHRQKPELGRGGGVLERVLSSVWLKQSQEPEFR